MRISGDMYAGVPLMLVLLLVVGLESFESSL